MREEASLREGKCSVLHHTPRHPTSILQGNCKAILSCSRLPASLCPNYRYSCIYIFATLEITQHCQLILIYLFRVCLLTFEASRLLSALAAPAGFLGLLPKQKKHSFPLLPNKIKKNCWGFLTPALYLLACFLHSLVRV